MPRSINISGHLLSLEQPLVMGILNVTPDSFYEGSRVDQLEQILAAGRNMMNEGAAILDLGGYSSRPGADDISLEEEIRRVIEPIRQLKSTIPDAVISIDTFRHKVAEAAVEAGASIVNDISGGHLDPGMYDFIASNRTPYVAMHMIGTPQNMTSQNLYDDLHMDIVNYFADIIDKLSSLGTPDVIIDPGFGFAKNPDQSFRLLDRLELFRILERPMLVGLSRKSMIYKTLGTNPEDALNGTTALNALALYKGADILRVHDVKPAAEAAQLIAKMREKN